MAKLAGIFSLLVLASFPASALPRQTQMNCGLDENHRYVYAAATSIRQISLDSVEAKLKARVEQKLKRPVFCLLEPGLYQGPLRDYGLAGQSSKDGNVYLVFDPDYIDHTEIVHELFHLKLRTEGVFVSGFDVKGPADVAPGLISEASRREGNLIQHRLFFARMRAIGLDPVAKQRKTMTEQMSDQNPPQWNSLNSVEAVYQYAECALLFGDPSFTRRYGDWLQKIGFREEVTKGKRIAESISRTDPRTKAQLQDELARDFTIMFEEEFTPSMFTAQADTLSK